MSPSLVPFRDEIIRVERIEREVFQEMHCQFWGRSSSRDTKIGQIKQLTLEQLWTRLESESGLQGLTSQVTLAVPETPPPAVLSEPQRERKLK